MVSLAKKALLEAWRRGYRIDEYGDAISPYSDRKLSLQDRKGYLRFSLAFNGRKIHVSVHRLAAFQKYRYLLFEQGIQVRHLDGDSRNNCFDNIVIGTATENQMDKSEKIRLRSARVAAAAQRKFTDEEIAQIRDMYASGKWRYKDIAEVFGVVKSTVSYIINRQTYNYEQLGEQ
jgi:hypothetical protein